MEIYLETNSSAGEIRQVHSSIEDFGFFALGMVRPVDSGGSTVTLLAEEEAEHAGTRSKRRIGFKCRLQSLSMQSVWLLAVKG